MMTVIVIMIYLLPYVEFQNHGATTHSQLRLCLFFMFCLSFSVGVQCSFNVTVYKMLLISVTVATESINVELVNNAVSFY